MKVVGHYLDMTTGKELPVVKAHIVDENTVHCADGPGLVTLLVNIPAAAHVSAGDRCHVALEFVNDFLAAPGGPFVRPAVVAVGQAYDELDLIHVS